MPFIHWLRARPHCKSVRVFQMEDIKHQLALNIFFGKPTHDPTLLLYHGHGGHKYWRINDVSTISYWTLLEWIQKINAPLLMINDCCHAGALIDINKRLRVTRQKIGIIAACPTDRMAYPGLQDKILSAWDVSTSYCPTTHSENEGMLLNLYKTIMGMLRLSEPETTNDESIRWGEVLDRHFF